MNKKTRSPLFHITKRDALPWYKSWGIRAAAILLALIVCSIITTTMTGENPLQVYATIFNGSFGSPRKVWVLLQNIAMLLCIALAVTPAFKMRFWNIGGEGQVLAGALAAAACMICLRNTLPNALVIVCMCVSSILAGALWGFIPAYFKAKYNTNETLFTLMMNYIAISFISYLQYGPWKDPESLGAAKIARFSDNAILPKVFGIHAGWIIMLALVVVMTILLKYTKLGYQIDVLGESETTARYAGMNTLKIMIIAVLLSGGLCGVAGFMQASAVEKSITDQMSGGLGFTAVITAWLAKLKPPVIVVVSFAFSMLLQSGKALQVMGIPSSITEVLQGVIIFFVLGSEFFINYKISFRKADKEG